MQPNRSQLQKVIEVLQNSNSGVICLPEKYTDDSLAAATALYLGLTQLGKNVTLACASEVTSSLLATDKIQNDITTSGDNLVISFPYQDGSIDKVDYFIQNDKFNIVVTPRAGTEKVNQDQVKYSYSGGNVEFFITIDAVSLRSLGALFTDNQELFKGKTIVNIDRHLTNSFFGTANFVSRTSSSLSEMILSLLKTMNAPIDKDIATNLYAGILAATNNFSSPAVNAETFEASALLLKSGAKKQSNGQPTPQQGTQPKSFERPGSRPMSMVERAPAMPSIEGSDFGQNEEEDDDDWLKPKIFKPGTSELG